MAFLAVGTVWWIILTILVVIGLLWAVDKCHPIFAAFSFIGYLAILQWFSHVPVFTTIAERPTTVVWLIGAYIGLGIVWSFIRWWLHIRQICSGKTPVISGYSLNEHKLKWIRDWEHNESVCFETERRRRERAGENPISEESPNHIRIAMDSAWQVELLRVKPLATNNKGLITVWILYWPISMLWSLVEDLMHEVLKWVIIRLRAVYDTIGNSAMRDS